MVINRSFLLIGFMGIAFALLFTWSYRNRLKFPMKDDFKLWIRLVTSAVVGAWFTFLAFFEHLLR